MFKQLILTLWVRFPLALFVARALVITLSFTAHELAHGLVATLLGDPTPRERGRLTLNPFKHMESIGVITGMLIGIGWSRRMPLSPHRMRLPGWLGGPLAVLAGPLANVGLVIGGMALLDSLGLQPAAAWARLPSLAELLTVLVRFNLTASLLNALPLFPLDAYQFIHYLLPLRAASWWERASGWTTAVLGVGIAFLLIMPSPLVIRVAGPPATWIEQMLLGW